MGTTEKGFLSTRSSLQSICAGVVSNTNTLRSIYYLVLRQDFFFIGKMDKYQLDELLWLERKLSARVFNVSFRIKTIEDLLEYLSNCHKAIRNRKSQARI